MDYYKGNGVFANAVDYYCLICEDRFYNGMDALIHLHQTLHKKNFKLTKYFGSKDDCVRKIKKWYLCEMCNIVLSTATKVRLHIAEQKHVEYRNDRLLERDGNFVVASSSVKIHDKAWNGIIDETCVICNTEFEDEKTHVNENMHIIKLIQSKTEFDANKNVYRKIDNSSIHCLTCNVAFALSTIDEHFNQSRHIKLYQKSLISVQNKNPQNDLKEYKAQEENLNDNEIEHDERITNQRECEKINAQQENLNKQKKESEEKFNIKQNKEFAKEISSPVAKPNISTKIIVNVDGEYSETNAKDDKVNKKRNTGLEKHVKTSVSQPNIRIKTILNAGNECDAKNAKDDKVNKKQTTDLENQVVSSVNETNISRKNVANVDYEYGRKNAKVDKVNEKQNTDLEKQIVSSVIETNISSKIVANAGNECGTKNAKDDNVNEERNTDLKKQIRCSATKRNISRKKGAQHGREYGIKNAKDDNINEEQNTDLVKQVVSSVTETNISRKNVVNVHNESGTKDAEVDDLSEKQNTDLEKRVSGSVTETNISRKKITKAPKKIDKEICEIMEAKNYVIKYRGLEMYCMLCVCTLLPTAVKAHTSSIHHQAMLKLHKERLSRLNANQITSSEAHYEILQVDKTNTKIYKEGISIMDSIEHYHQNGIQIYLNTHKAYCLKCLSSIKFNKDFIEKHIKEHTKNLKGYDMSNEQNIKQDDSILDSIENFQENDIHINFEVRMAFCKKCSISLDFNKNCIEDHIKNHDKHLELNDEHNSSIKDSADNFEKNDIVINFELKTAHCKKCSISLDFDKTFIENHIKAHPIVYISEKKKTKGSQVTIGYENRKAKNVTNKNAPKKKGKAKQRTYTEEDIKQIAEENDFTYTANSKEVHCIKCKTKIPPVPKNMIEHIEGFTHRSNLDKPDPSTDKTEIMLGETINKIKHKKVPIASFVTSCATIKAVTFDIVLNNKICLNIYSFALVIKLGDKLVCQICKTIENADQITQHLERIGHSSVYNNCIVIVDGDEFIREVPGHGFHCGYCNMLEPSWECLQNHMQRSSHLDHKNSGRWRLQQYMPKIQKQHVETRSHFMFEMVMEDLDLKLENNGALQPDDKI